VRDVKDQCLAYKSFGGMTCHQCMREDRARDDHVMHVINRFWQVRLPMAVGSTLIALNIATNV
jgi:hypothetical protein